MSLTSNSVEKINTEMFRFVEKMKRSRETVFMEHFYLFIKHE